MSSHRIPLLLIIIASLVSPYAAAADRPKIGSQIENLRFKDIRYLQRSLSDFGEPKAVVLVFSNTTCPVVQRYWPKLQRVQAKYREQGVQFVSVNISGDDEIAEVAQQAIDFGVDFPFVKDVDGSCARALGIERTPEVVILDAGRKLRYRGRIDDQQRVGGARPAASSEDLTDAIEALLVDKEIKVAETTVD
jgi:thiol-disulfide isomerase/thioredoxin